MLLETIINELKYLKKSFEKGKSLKLYCEQKNISYTSTSRILKRGIETMQLITAYNILGLTPERNISQVVLDLKIQDLKQIKKDSENGNL